MKKRLRKLSDIGEFDLIERLIRRIPQGKYIKKGIGDDTAVWPAEGRFYWLFTTDQIAEGVDFDLKRARPELIGWKAIAANVSDIAAMGGWPIMATISLGLPASSSIRFVDRLYSGIKRAAKRFRLDIAGGDLSCLKDVVISVAMIGKVERANLTLRSGAKVGDNIFVSGKLGGSILKKHLTFEPRLELARYLVTHYRIHSMIDVSDGLTQDLGHIVSSSKRGAKIYVDEIPVSRAAKRLACGSEKRAVRHALTDGEDFELLWTMPEKEARRLLKKKVRHSFRKIGVITKNRGLNLVRSECDERKIRLNLGGFRHF